MYIYIFPDKMRCGFPKWLRFPFRILETGLNAFVEPFQWHWRDDDHNRQAWHSIRRVFGIWYVTVWDCDRAYGGSEEGGWFYDTGRPVESIRVPTWHLAKWIARIKSDRLEIQENEKGYRADLSSVCCEGRLQCWHHKSPPAAFPDYIPHYE